MRYYIGFKLFKSFNSNQVYNDTKIVIPSPMQADLFHEIISICKSKERIYE